LPGDHAFELLAEKFRVTRSSLMQRNMGNADHLRQPQTPAAPKMDDS
jgi:hypothetical protein